jgi:hypothetical protein
MAGIVAFLYGARYFSQAQGHDHSPEQGGLNCHGLYEAREKVAQRSSSQGDGDRHTVGAVGALTGPRGRYPRR